MSETGYLLIRTRSVNHPTQAGPGPGPGRRKFPPPNPIAAAAVPTRQLTRDSFDSPPKTRNQKPPLKLTCLGPFPHPIAVLEPRRHPGAQAQLPIRLRGQAPAAIGGGGGDRSPSAEAAARRRRRRGGWGRAAGFDSRRRRSGEAHELLKGQHFSFFWESDRRQGESESGTKRENRSRTSKMIN